MKRFAFFLLVCIGVSSCEQDQQERPQVPEVKIIPEQHAEEANALFWQHQQLILNELAEISASFDAARIQFLASPNEETLIALQESWSPLVTLQNKLFLFSSMTQRLPETLSLWTSSSYRLFAHPIQPGYLDSFGEYKFAGIVHDIGLPITTESLIQQHGFADTESATLGVYAIEFLIFGENESRSFKEYIVTDTLSKEQTELGYKDTHETPNFRRRQLLSAQSETLLADASALTNSWQSTTKDGLNIAWQELGKEAQFSLMSSALQKGFTELLIRVSNHKKELDALSLSHPEKKLYHVKEISNSLLANFQSLESGLGFLDEEQAKIISEELTKAKAVLISDQPSIAWEILYESVKTSAELLTL